MSIVNKERKENALKLARIYFMDENIELAGNKAQLNDIRLISYTHTNIKNEKIDHIEIRLYDSYHECSGKIKSNNGIDVEAIELDNKNIENTIRSWLALR
jgi:hypothetical protein